MRRPALYIAPIALVAALGLASCSGEDGEDGEDAAASATATQTDASAEPTANEDAPPPGDELPGVSGAFGADPTVEFPGTGAPEDLQVEVLSSGDGAVVGADDFVVADYHGQVWDGDVFDSSFERGAPTGFSLNGVIPGWKEGLTGTHVGDRVLLSIPSELGYPEGTPDGSIQPGDTLVFVVDVVGAYAPDATGEADAAPVEPAPDAPVTVSGDLGAPVTLTVEEGADVPDEPAVTVLAEGTGEAVPGDAGTTVVVQFAEALWDNSEQSSTWETSGATGVALGSGGVFDMLADVPVGSRVLIELPGAEETETTEASPGLAAVVDILGAHGPTGD